MASDSYIPPPEGLTDDFYNQILVGASYAAANDSTAFGGGGSMMLQLGSGGGGDGPGHGTGFHGMGMGMPLGLNLEHGFLKPEEVNANNNAPSSSTSGMNGLHVPSFLPAFGNFQTLSVRPSPPPPPTPAQFNQPFHGQPPPRTVAAPPHPPSMRPRVRARRGQATDPHSIAERIRREKIAERMRALQDLVPSANRTDRAAMLDEIVDYVKFLRLQVKVLSMSRLGGAQLVPDVPISSVEGEGIDGQTLEKWSTDETELEVAKLMEQDIGAAMKFLQSKALCIMPLSVAPAIFRTHQPETESNTDS